jgi:hypothetical protein
MNVILPTPKLSRRTMLRSVGASICLPLLESMNPIRLKAEASKVRPIKRVGYFYFPNGIPRGIWHPAEVNSTGALQKLNPWMSPLEAHKSQLLIPTNIWTPEGNGHSAGTATWLTGGGYDDRAVRAGGVSVDQLIAKHAGQQTMLPSLEMSLKGEGFFSNSLPRNAISWSPNNVPMTREVEPRAIFDRMFRPPEGGVSNLSVMDLVLGEAKSLNKQIGRADQNRLEEYFESIRALEKRIEFAEIQTLKMKQDKALTQALTAPTPGIPSDHEEYIRLMMDMIALAYWSDATRVASFMLDHGQSNRYFNFIDGVRGTWHALSHYGNASGMTEDDDGKTSWDSVDTKREMYAEVIRWHHRQFAYLLNRLQSIQEPDGGSVLDNSMLLYGSSLGDGDEHDENDLPTLIAGGGAGTIRSGRQVQFNRRTDLSKVHLAFLHRLGIQEDQFGSAKGDFVPLDFLG